MAYTTTPYMPLKMPTPGSREPAQIALLNENAVVLSGHDHSNGKGLPVTVLRSGLEANRPAAGNAGAVYLATDTGQFYVDTGTAWASFLTTAGASTVTGWTLVDPIIRDTLLFGPEPTGTADTSITRSGPGGLTTNATFKIANTIPDLRWVDTDAPDGNRAWSFVAATDKFIGRVLTDAEDSAMPWVTVTRAGQSVNGVSFGAAVSVVGGVSGFVFHCRDDANRQWQWYSDTAGGAQLYQATPEFNGNRLQVTPVGTLSLMPTAGNPAIQMPASATVWANGQMNIHAENAGHLYLKGASGYVLPITDTGQHLGHPSVRWTTIYCSVAPVVGSSADLKRDIAPLDPEACVAAVLGTDWVSFTYLPPAYQETEPLPADAYDEHDSNEAKAEKKAARAEAEAKNKAAHAKMLVETAPSRDQKGYVLQSPGHKVSDLFGLSDRTSASTHADLAVVACALQDALRRLAVLEANDAAPA